MSEERGDLRQPSHEPHAALAIAQSRLVPKRVSLSWRHGRGPGHVPLLARREARDEFGRPMAGLDCKRHICCGSPYSNGVGHDVRFFGLKSDEHARGG